jgi:DNA polymerase-3 subunit gamma/tau
MAATQFKPVLPDDDNSEASQTPPPPAGFASFDELVAYVSSKRDVKLVRELERHVLPVSIGTGRIELSLLPDAPAGIANELSRRLEAWTGNRWIVSVSTSAAPGQTIADQKRERRDDLFRRARESYDVQAVLKGFPRAEILEVRDLKAETVAPIGEHHDLDGDVPNDLAD